MTQIQRWHWKSWHELTRNELYALLQLRQAVFVVEQNCPYLDADGKDDIASHLLGWDHSNNLVAYSRVFLPLNGSTSASIGRVIVHASVRGSGLGYELMRQSESLALEHSEHPLLNFTLSAQAHLHSFYSQLGYQTSGPGYDEDGIPHLPMQKDL